MAKKILVADDETDILLPTVVRLQKAGYAVRMANDGQAALEEAGREAPDLFLLDYHMPKLNGFDLVRRIREDSALKGLPIIIMTASADRAASGSLQAAGIQAYIVKPFEGKELLTTVSRLIGPAS